MKILILSKFIEKDEVIYNFTTNVAVSVALFYYLSYYSAIEK